MDCEQTDMYRWKNNILKSTLHFALCEWLDKKHTIQG